MNIYVKSFACGFLYIFGLVNLPITGQIQKYIYRDDKTAISNDWKNVGLEIHKSYESAEKPTA